MAEQKKKVIHTFEPVTFPQFKMGEVKAKIDTGAYSGALHCTKIREELTTNGDRILRFSPFDRPDIEISVSDFAMRHVRSSNGTGQSRYFITTKLTIRGKTYPIILSLADRSEMKWPVLIGRRFLRENNFIVDVTPTKS